MSLKHISNLSLACSRSLASDVLTGPAEGEGLGGLQLAQPPPPHFFENYKELLRKKCFQPLPPPPPHTNFESLVSPSSFKIAPRALAESIINLRIISVLVERDPVGAHDVS